MIDISTLKILVKRNVNDTADNENSYNKEYSDIDNLLVLSAKKILELFDSYYDMGVEGIFSIDLGSSYIKYTMNKDEKYILFNGSENVLITSKMVHNGILVNDFTTAEGRKNSTFSRGLAKGLINITDKRYILECCNEIAKHIYIIKRQMANKLIIKSDENLDRSEKKLNKIRSSNDVLREFTKDVIVGDSNDGEKEGAAE